MLKLEDFETLAAAKEYSFFGQVGKSDFAQHDARFDVERILNDCLANPDSPANLKPVVRVFRSIINGLLESTNIGSTTIQPALDYLVDISDELCAYTQVMRNHLEGLSKVYPHINRTELDFQIAKGTIQRFKLDMSLYQNGRCFISTNADCEFHTPQIYKRLTYTNSPDEYVRVAGFLGVKKAGPYRAACPFHDDLWVDNAYGVIAE
tara:strand:+ start:622 stop:1242 length:621 start_codon:yes stop_codon:yes gene_type:complete